MENQATSQSPLLSICVREAEKKGYRENFKMADNFLTTADGQKQYSSNEVVIENFYIVDNYLTPNNRTILYLLQTSDKLKGIITDFSDAHNEERFSQFMMK